MTQIPQDSSVLKNSVDYFQQVVLPNYETFFSGPSSFVNAINLATALFHFHEWLFSDYKDEIIRKYSTTSESAGSFWGKTQELNRNFGYIRDMTNASKHVALKTGKNIGPSTGMTHIANVHIESSSYGSGGYGSGSYGGAPSMIFDDSGQSISFDTCAEELYQHWKALIKELSGQILLDR